MSASDLLRAALAADPIAFTMAAVALVLVAIAILFRRGGVDARFIIQVFSILATIGTIPKIALWVGSRMLDSPHPSELSGADLVLAAGGLVAIVWSGAQELLAVFVGDRKEPSLAGRWWTGSIPELLSKWLPQKTEPVKETPEAVKDRERLKAEQPPH